MYINPVCNAINFIYFSFTFTQHNMFRPYMAIFRYLNLSKLPHCI
jgi:hypothetical protein